MMRFTKGNLLAADVEALVNTVNTVGIMGKGIALMFKERFPDNFKAYVAACKRGEIDVGRMFVTATSELKGPRWIINFPTKRHWRTKTKPEWIEAGLTDLKAVIQERGIKSIAIPPLGCGNGGLDWLVVRPMIEEALDDLACVDVVVYEPTGKYQNVAKRTGVEKLTPARALMAEMVRRYEVLGFDCTILEVQKLAWCLERVIEKQSLANPLALDFAANRFGPFAPALTHLLDKLDGSYLHCDKRLADAQPLDIIRFDQEKRTRLREYLARGEGAAFADAIDRTDRLIDGFQSPLGMEVLATVDWLLSRDNARPTVTDIRRLLRKWANDASAAARKDRVFTDKLIQAALDRLTEQLHAA